MMTEESKATFNLYAVLGAICFLGLLISGFLWNSLATGKAERIATNIQVEARLTRLEANFTYIVQGISELKAGQMRAAEQAREVAERLLRTEQRESSSKHK